MQDEVFVFPLSLAQEWLWLVHRMDGGSSLYNISLAFRLTGSLDVSLLERSLNHIIQRHEALRTTFAVEEGKPVQVISPVLNLRLRYVDLRQLSVSVRQEESRRLAASEGQRSFDLVREPLVRTSLLQLGEQDYILLVVIHHLIFDGWSGDVFLREFLACYQAFSAGRDPLLPELPLQYADFAQWQRQGLQGDVLQNLLSYWKYHLRGTLPALRLSTDRPAPPRRSFQGRRQLLRLASAPSQALRVLSQREGCTLFMTLLGAFTALLYRYTGQDDILVGSPVANRNQVEVENLIGFFANVLVLRIDLTGDPPFRELLGRVREVTLDAFAHQDLPFETLVEELKPEGGIGRGTLFQVMFQLRNAPDRPVELPGLRIDDFEFDRGICRLDLNVDLLDKAEGLSGWVEYNTDVFDAATIARMIGHFQTLLEGIAAHPAQRLSRLPLLTAIERHQRFVEWNNSKTASPRDPCVHHLFKAQVDRTPDAVAVVFEHTRLTYRELNRRADQVAHHLHSLGVGPETLVAICMDRSPELVIGLLGILKAGGGYVPLEPGYSREQLAFILADSRAPVLLTQRRLMEASPNPGTRVICLDGEQDRIVRGSGVCPDGGVRAEGLACVLYTAGSTGRPKGVQVTHRGLVCLSQGSRQDKHDGPEVFLQLSPLSSGGSAFEIWASLLKGACLVVMPRCPVSAEELGLALRQYQITTLWLPTALFHRQVEEDLESLRPVRELIVGGDVLSGRHAQTILQVLGEVRLIHAYGAVEHGIVTCCFLMADGSQMRTPVPIGRPMANTEIHVLDRHLQPVPVGVPGELYVGGDGLARGYLHRPELTAEKFLPHSFSGERGARLYKTGDLARYLHDGNLEFLGRIGHQVTAYGAAADVGRTEAALAQHPSVREAVVLPGDDRVGHGHLIAYVVPRPRQKLTVQDLRRYLKSKLPRYQLPSAFVLLDCLPLTPYGKVNLQALRARAAG